MTAEPAVIQKPPFGAHDRWPIYDFTQYLYSEKCDVHILGTAGVSEWMMRESQNLVENLIGALQKPEDRKKFAGHRAFLVTDADPSIPGSVPGHRNTGGNGFSMFNEVLACATSVDTIRPNAKPEKRAWDTPVHEFAHSVEHTLCLEKSSDEVYRKNVQNYNPKVAREYFTWSVQRWFSSSGPKQTRESMPKWEYDYIASVFDETNTWKPQCTREGKVYERSIDAATPKPEDNRPEPVKIDHNDIEALVGTYRASRVINDWHIGSITIEEKDAEGHPSRLKWTNKAGRSWGLYPELKSGALRVGEDSPYFKKGETNCYWIAVDNTKKEAPRVAGFWDGNTLYIKDE